MKDFSVRKNGKGEGDAQREVKSNQRGKGEKDGRKSHSIRKVRLLDRDI